MILHKVIASISDATGLQVIYGSAYDVNAALAGVALPCAYVALFGDVDNVKVGGQWVERADVAVGFINKTEFAIDELSNYDIIEGMRVHALRWLDSLNDSATLVQVNEAELHNIYDEFDDIVTGVVVRVKVGELLGLGCNYQPNSWHRDLIASHNGYYDVDGIEVLRVAIAGCRPTIGGEVLSVKCGTVADERWAMSNDLPEAVEGVRYIESNGEYNVAGDSAVLVGVQTIEIENETLKI